MKIVRMIAPLAVVLAGTACAGISVTSDWDPTFDFDAPQTFAVLDDASGEGMSQLNAARVKSSIVTVMQERGFERVDDPAQADIAVGFQFTSEQRSSYETVNTGWNTYGYGGYQRWGGVGVSSSTTTERRYDVGSLIIAVFDVEAKNMVYTGTGSKTLSDGNHSPEETQRRIDDAVFEILRDFPPG